MAAPTTYRDVHLPLSVLRAAGVTAMAVAVALNSSWTEAAAEQVGWIVVATVAAGSLVAWGWARGSRSEKDAKRIGALGFLLDIVLVLGAVWVFTFEHDFLIVVLLPLVPLSGALRFRWTGAVVGLLVVGAFLVPMSMRHVVVLTGTEVATPSWSWTSSVFVGGVCAAVGIAMAVISQSWHRRRLEFEHQASRLVELDRLKDRYIAVTTHEIRGPLSAMISAIDTVKARWDKIDPERREHLLEMVYLQGRELDRLVQDLFISAEVQSGGLQLQPEWVELEPTIKRAVDAASAKRRGHLLELFVDPLRVDIDPYRVSQIIRNLVENAYKYTPDRTRVLVSAKGVPDGIQLEVLDHCEGIPPNKRDLLFEAFSRIEETTAGQEGVGLGLYVVSQLVAAMNGRIDLQSSSRGTIFSIYIPCPTASLDRSHIGLVGEEKRTHG